jgi:hypothetical protein
MKITDYVGQITVELGEPSINHIRIFADEAYPVTIHISEWEELKKKIDKMFKIAKEI